MKLKLVSDFSETYDAFFDAEGYEFRRVTTEGPNRTKMFDIFRRLGLNYPRHGYYTQYLSLYNPTPDDLVVVHTDITKHCGEGKELMRFGEISPKHRGPFICEYILPIKNVLGSGVKGESLRYLFVGNRCFLVEYFSFDDWRSNCGEGGFSPITEIPCPRWREDVYYPLFAVDFVGPQTGLKAIDFNIAPGIKGLSLPLMSHKSIVTEIKEWYKWMAK